MLQEAQFANVGIDLNPRHLKSMAIDALRSKESVELVKESDIVDVNGELNMTGVAGAGPSVLPTRCAARRISA